MTDSGRGHRAGVPDAAARRDRLARHPAQRIAQLSAKRLERQEDFELHHPQGRRPACRSCSRTMRADYEAKWDDLKIFIQYGILTDEKFAEKAAGIHALEERRRQIFHPQGVCGEGEGEPDRQEQDGGVPLCGRSRGEAHVPRSGQRQGVRRAGDGRPAGQPLHQLVRVEEQGVAFRARRQRRGRQTDPEGGECQDVAHRGPAGGADARFREPDAQGRQDSLQHLVRGHVARRGSGGDHAERVHAPHEGDGRRRAAEA